MEGPAPQGVPAAESKKPAVAIEPEVTVRSRLILVLGLLFGFIVVVVGTKAGGVVGEVAFYGLESYPIAVISFFAYIGVKKKSARIAAWILSLVYLLLFAAFTQYTVWLLKDIESEPPVTVFLVYPALLLTLVMVAANRNLRQGFRVVAPRITRIDPDNRVHVLALFLLVSLVVILVAPLLTEGVPPLLELAKTGDFINEGGLDPRLGFVVSLLWVIPCVFVAAGYGVARNFSDVLSRLGLTGTTLRYVLFAVLASLVLVAAASGFDFLVKNVWNFAGWPVTEETVLRKLFSDMLNPFGAILASLAAGVGEELVVRGLLQKRFGILLSNVFFTALHAMQYYWDALLGVFLSGIVMGVIRKRTNTVTCMIIHTLYNILSLWLFTISVGG